MLEVDLLGEETDLEHVKDLHQRNNSEEDIEVLTEILSILFDEEQTSEEKQENFEELIDQLPDDGDLDLTEIEIEESIRGIEQLQRIIPKEFEYMRVIFEYVLDLGESLDEAEAAQEQMRSGEMDELSLTIPREDESPSGLAL